MHSKNKQIGSDRVGDLDQSLKPTYSDLKFDVESIGEGFGAIEEVARAANAENSILPIFSCIQFNAKCTILNENE